VGGGCESREEAEAGEKVGRRRTEIEPWGGKFRVM
jgi:hypothetical protein